jgi:Zn-dependent peptidase ImmA (M78 family)
MKADLDASGLTDPNCRTIFLSPDQNAEDMLDTLIHELGHAMFRRLGIVNAVDSQAEEIIVSNYAALMIDVFGMIKPKTPPRPKKTLPTSES